MKLLITIDTEEDDAWSGRQVIETENVRFLPRFQALADRFGFPPTWLADEPVLADPRFADAVGESVLAGRAEVGAHLHPWSCRPFPGDVLPNQAEQVYPHELSEPEFRAKMARTIQLIKDSFGILPVSYRAGRWGLAAEHVPWLLDLGIRIDCSVTPHLSWRQYRGKRGGNGGIDYRGSPHLPYWIEPSDVRRSGRSGLLELPMTVAYLDGPFRSPALQSLGDRIRYSPFGKVLPRLEWGARPFRPWPGRGLEVLKAFLTAAEGRGDPYLMLMFHSSELMPGGSPYCPTEESVEALYVQLAALFEFLTERGIEGSTLRGFAQPYFNGTAKALGEAAEVLALERVILG